MISYKPYRVLVVERNLDSKDLIRDLGLSPNTVAKLNAKKDDNEPVSLQTIEKLCKYFGVSVDKIVEIL